MNKETYRRLFDRVSPGSGLMERVRGAAREADRPGRRYRPWRRGIAVAAALALCLTVGVPALAGNVPAAYELLYAVAPGAAQLFAPVREVSEKNGIRMEVVSARVEGDTAELFVSLRDLTGDRVDGTTDLFDSYSIRKGFDAVGTCSLYEWNEETKTAVFLVSVSRMDGKPITGEKLTFRVREFISDKLILEDVPVELALSDEDAGVREVHPTGLAGSAVEARSDSRQTWRVLEPGEALLEPAPEIFVTGMGRVDGKLHLQLSTADKLTLDSHGFVYLVDGDGNRIDSEYSVSYTEQDGGSRVDHQDFVFDVSPERLEGCSLYGSFRVAGQRAEGPWQVTFPMPESGE